MSIYQGSFSEVMIKIILTEQLVLYVFLLILSILKDVHAKKPAEDKPDHFGSQKDPNKTSKTSNFTKSENLDSEQDNALEKGKFKKSKAAKKDVRSRALYKKKKDKMSVKSDKMHDFRSKLSELGSLKVQSEKRGNLGRNKIYESPMEIILDERKFMTNDIRLDGNSGSGSMEFAKSKFSFFAIFN